MPIYICEGMLHSIKNIWIQCPKILHNKAQQNQQKSLLQNATESYEMVPSYCPSRVPSASVRCLCASSLLLITIYTNMTRMLYGKKHVRKFTGMRCKNVAGIITLVSKYFFHNLYYSEMWKLVSSFFLI